MTTTSTSSGLMAQPKAVTEPRATPFETASNHDVEVIDLVRDYFADLHSRGMTISIPSRDDLAAEVGVVVLVARDDDGLIATGALRRWDDATGEIKRMYVVPRARGRGLAVAILRALEDRAAAMGYNRVVLDTAAETPEAYRLYIRQGYKEVAKYNDNPHASFWFEKEVAVQA